MYEYEDDYFEVDENFEFNTGMNKLLDQEVEKRLAERVKNYQDAIDRDNRSQKTISDLRNQMHVLQLQLDAAEKTFKKEGVAQATRDILGGYKLGDEVWFTKSNYSREECPVCLGDKEVVAEIKSEEVKIRCPKCDGYGYKSKMTKSAERGVIKEIEVHTWAEGRQLDTRMYITPTTYKSSDNIDRRTGEFFKTKDECESEINKS